MQPRHLLRLFPRGWRERYGDEFVALLADRPPTPMQLVDVVSTAIDAWLSADVRRQTGASQPSPGGTPMLLRMLSCGRTTGGVTPLDGLYGAAVMLAVTVLFKTLGLKELSFPVAFTVSMPFWLMKGQPWKAQVAIVGGTLALLLAIS